MMLEYLSFRFEGKKITFAFGDTSYPTGEGTQMCTIIEYRVDDKNILVAECIDDEESDFSELVFDEAHEFHNDAAALDLLKKIAALISHHEQQAKHSRREEENNTKKGKFTL